VYVLRVVQIITTACTSGPKNYFENRLIFGKVKAYKNGANYLATLYVTVRTFISIYGILSSSLVAL